MRTCQESFNFFHDLGVSDAKLGERYGKRREQVCKIRHGTEKGSEELRAILHDDVEEAIAYQTQHTQPQLTQQAPIEAEVTHLPATLYDPSAQYIAMPSPRPARTVHPHTHHTPVQEPARRKRPLTYAEIVARNEAYKQAYTPLVTPKQSQPAKQKSPYDDTSLLELVAMPFWLAGEIGKALFSRKPKQPLPVSIPETSVEAPIPTTMPLKPRAPEPKLGIPSQTERVDYSTLLSDENYRMYRTDF